MSGAARGQTLDLLSGALAVARLEPGAASPPWAGDGEVVSVTRTGSELSIVCAETGVPPQVTAERGFRCLRVVGPLDFAETGILASLAGPLAQAGVSLFALSTFDTDYLLIRQADLERALAALAAAGHTVRQPGSAPPG